MTTAGRFLRNSLLNARLTMMIFILGRVNVTILFRKSARTKSELVSCRRTAQFGNKRVGDPLQHASVIAWLPAQRKPGIFGIDVRMLPRNTLRL